MEIVEQTQRADRLQAEVADWKRKSDRHERERDSFMAQSANLTTQLAELRVENERLKDEIRLITAPQEATGNVVHALMQQNAALRAEIEGRWQPIESAPKDGQEILIFYPAYRLCGAGETYRKVDHNRVDVGVLIGSKIATAYWYSAEQGHWWSKPDGGYWETLSGQSLGGLAESAPTHWQPLPKPPAEGEVNS